MDRLDGRGGQDMREMTAELGHAPEADGSVLFSLGKTCVAVSMHGPAQPKYSRLEKFDKCTLSVEYKSVSITDSNSRMQTEKNLERFVSSCLSQAIDLAKHPRMTLLLRITVLNDDGSLLSAVINACVLALLDAGISLLYTPVRKYYFKNFHNTALQVATSYIYVSNHCIVDPSKSEAECASSVHDAVFKKQAEEVRLLSMCSHGQFTREQCSSGINTVESCVESIDSYFRACIENKMMNSHKIV